MNNSFYMIYVEGCNSPTYKHDSFILAEHEALRLAELTGKETFILCSLKSLKKQKIVTKDLRPDREDLELPF